MKIAIKNPTRHASKELSIAFNLNEIMIMEKKLVILFNLGMYLRNQYYENHRLV